MKQAARMAFRQAVAQHQGKEKGSDDAEQAAEHSADQAPQAQSPNAQFKEDDESGDSRTDTRCSPGREAKRTKEPAGYGKDKDKEQTKSE